LRYHGQSYELNVPWSGVETAAAFHREHERLYGYAHASGKLGSEVEVVTVRVRARTVLAHPTLKGATGRAAGAKAAARRVWTGDAWESVAVWERSQLSRVRRRGPALVADYGATTLIPTGWSVSVDAAGNMVLLRAA
jgi:N-methylhydantoinase A